jgi:hypothetical protein
MSNNPLLSTITSPGETFQLPSCGVFYSNGEVSEEVLISGEVYVNPMTTLDEIIMKTPDKLLNGTAVTEVFRRCIPSILKPSELLVNDVDFLLTCLRKVSYGNTVDITYDHGCGEEIADHSYVLDVSGCIDKATKIDPTSVEHEYSVKLTTNQIVYFTPLRFRTLMALYHDMNDDKTDSTRLHSVLITSIVDTIIKVDDVSDKRMIREWLEKSPRNVVSEIQTCLEGRQPWGANFSIDTTCQECGEGITIKSPINPINFFLLP